MNITKLCSLFLAGWATSLPSVEAVSTIQIVKSIVPMSYPENWGEAVVTVQRTGDLDTAVSVDFATVDGTALAGRDFQTTSGTLSFQVGETNRTVRIPLLNDALPEPIESFQLVLSNPAGAVL